MKQLTAAPPSPPQKCCGATDKCVSVNKYYSKCDTPTAEGLLGRVQDSCPGLEGCPAGDNVEA